MSSLEQHLSCPAQIFLTRYISRLSLFSLLSLFMLFVIWLLRRYHSVAQVNLHYKCVLFHLTGSVFVCVHLVWYFWSRFSGSVMFSITLSYLLLMWSKWPLKVGLRRIPLPLHWVMQGGLSSCCSPHSALLLSHYVNSLLTSIKVIHRSICVNALWPFWPFLSVPPLPPL